MGDEVDALFDICEASLKEAAPDFNLDHLIGSVTETGRAFFWEETHGGIVD